MTYINPNVRGCVWLVIVIFVNLSGTLDGPVNTTVSINVLKGKATLTLTGLGSFVYDGTPKVATATTKPSGLTTVTVAYNEITAAPSAVGTYTVVATLTESRVIQ